ncbi:hypothetical protein PENFLA_c050G01150 [Penicillium flavigenum]|uniref:Uncharacterized protein n=1 Tax=Penicillium flavigenum TaxID=254877 RepID=A0A1V6SID5_9EURO|nr:hypothetical protein PENFLA_c050G01150 [Penicillium flavigenum]
MLSGHTAMRLGILWLWRDGSGVYKDGILHIELVLFITQRYLHTKHTSVTRYLVRYCHTSTPTQQSNQTQTNMPTQPRTTDSEHARLQNDYGADYWVRNSAQEHRRATAGRGLFAGLQDVKHYNVDHGWARRKSETSQPGILGSLWSRLTGL